MIAALATIDFQTDAEQSNLAQKQVLRHKKPKTVGTRTPLGSAPANTSEVAKTLQDAAEAVRLARIGRGWRVKSALKAM